MLLKFLFSFIEKLFFVFKNYINLIFLLGLSLAISSHANAVTFNISEPTLDGTFTLSWSGAHSFVQLDLKVDNGITERVGEYAANGGPLTFTKPPGTYLYTLIDIEARNGPVYAERGRVQKTVVVITRNPPVISGLPLSASINEWTQEYYPFTVRDSDTQLSELQVSASSDNTSVATAGVTGSNGSYTLIVGTKQITDSSASRNATITVTVSGGSASPVTKSFMVTSNNVPAKLTSPSSSTSTTGKYNVSWGYAGAGVMILENGTEILRTTSGSGSIPITQTINRTYTYELVDCVYGPNSAVVCDRTNTTDTKSIAVEIPPTVNPHFDKTEVNENNSGATNTSAKLTWSSTNAPSCTATGISGVNGSSGEATFYAPSTLSADQTATVNVTCTGAGGSVTKPANILVKSLNDSPIISSISSQSINEGSSTGAVSFSVSDEETAAVNLQVTATSNSQTLIPDGNLQLVNSGSSRSITATPVAGRSGNATITVTVRDAANVSASTQFNVQVINTTPTPTLSLNFDKSDVNENNPGATNTTARLIWSGTGVTSCNATGITGVSNISGDIPFTAPSVLMANQDHEVSITCTGAGGSITKSAKIALKALNDIPTISAISKQVIDEDTNTGAINFLVNDEETPVGNLQVIPSSDSQLLIPDANLQLNGNGNSRNITATPLTDRYGNARITLTVKDALNSLANSQFDVEVKAVDDLPVITGLPSALTMNETSVENYSFNIIDPDTALNDLQVTAISDNTSVVKTTLTGANGSYNLQLSTERIIGSGIESLSAAITINVSGGSATPVVKVISLISKNVSAKLTITPSSDNPALYTVSWEYASAAAKIYEDGADISGLIDPSGFVPPSGSRTFVKTESGIYNYAIKNCVYGQNGLLNCDHTDDTKSINVSLSLPSAPVLDSPSTSNTGEYVVTWSNIPGTINYKLYENEVLIHNSGSTLKSFQGGTRKGNGVYEYKVKACILTCSEFSNIKTTVVSIVSSSSSVDNNSSNSSENNTSNSSTSNSAVPFSSKSSSSAGSRRVIFIHTDLLGSPAAETDIEGNANE